MRVTEADLRDVGFTSDSTFIRQLLMPTGDERSGEKIATGIVNLLPYIVRVKGKLLYVVLYRTWGGGWSRFHPGSRKPADQRGLS